MTEWPRISRLSKPQARHPHIESSFHTHEEYHPKSGSTVEAECSMEILVQLETKRPNREDILWNIAKMAIYRVEQSDAKMEKAIC